MEFILYITLLRTVIIFSQSSSSEKVLGNKAKTGTQANTWKDGALVFSDIANLKIMKNSIIR